ncbi:MAG: ubiquinone biosynthesis protein COQ9 [Candidatus Midichloriaceae bacterium]|jgi:ubiquinone biosynthesis protein COQ9
MENIPSLRHKVLLSVLEILPYEQFDSNIISKGCINIGIEKEYDNLLFPNGRMQLLDLFRDHIDSLMLEELNKILPDINSVTARIYEAIKIRIKLLDEYKISMSKISTFFALPWNHVKLYPHIWHTMHIIWKIAGKDKSTDFNYYSKRGLLTAAYLSTIMYWLSDESDDNQDTYDFLQRSLNGIVNVGKKINKLKESCSFS